MENTDFSYFPFLFYMDAQKVALIFLREVGAIDNITYRQLSGASAKDASKRLKALVNLNFIEAKGQRRQTYYVPTNKLKSLYIPNSEESDAKGAISDAKDESLKDNNISIWNSIPDNLREKINNLGERVPKALLFDLIVELCRVKIATGGNILQFIAYLSLRSLI